MIRTNNSFHQSIKTQDQYTKNSITFQYSRNEQTKNEIKKIILLTIDKTCKYKFNKKQTSNSENQKMLLKKINLNRKTFIFID